MLLGTVTSHQACYSKVPPLLSRLERQQSQSWHPGWWQHLCFGQTLNFFSFFQQVKLFTVPAFSPAQEKIPFARVNHNKYMVTDKQVSQKKFLHFWNIHLAGLHWHLQLVWRLLHLYWWRWLCVHWGVEESVGFHLWKRLVKLLCFPITTSKKMQEQNITSIVHK